MGSMVMVIFKLLSVGIRTCGCARMLRWRRCLVVFAGCSTASASALVACRIEQAPAFARGRRRFAAEHGFAVFELGRGFGFDGVLTVLEPFAFFLSSVSSCLGFHCLYRGGMLRLQFFQVRSGLGDRFRKRRKLSRQFPVQFFRLACDRERRRERSIVL